MSKIADDLRSGLSFKLLDWALKVAPKSERALLAGAIHQHANRCLSKVLVSQRFAVDGTVSEETVRRIAAESAAETVQHIKTHFAP